MTRSRTTLFAYARRGLPADKELNRAIPVPGPEHSSDPLSPRKRDVVRLAAVSSLAGIIGRIISVPTAILVAQVLGPFLLGILALLRLMQTYLGFSHLGLLAALPRNVPLAYGRGDREEAASITNVVVTGTAISAAIAALLLSALYLAGVTFNGALTPPRLGLLTAMFFTAMALSILRDHAKAEGRLMAIAKTDLFMTVALPLMTVAGVWVGKLEGALAAATLVNAASVLYSGRLLGWPRFKPVFDAGKTLELLRTGSLVFVNKLGDNFFWSVDLLVIGALMTPRDVGLYSLTLGAIAAVHPFLWAFNNVVYRRIMEETGEKGTDDLTHYRKYAGSSSFVSYLLLNSLILGVAAIGLDAVVRVALPEFSESPPIMIVLTLGYTIYGSMVFMRYYLDATGQLPRRLSMVAGAVVVNVLLDYSAISLGFGLRGVAWACTMAFALNAGFILIFCFRQIYGDWREGALFVVQLLVIAVLCFVFLSAASGWSIWRPDTVSRVHVWLAAAGDVAVKSALFVAWCTASYLVVFRRNRLSREILPAFHYCWLLIRARAGAGGAAA